jgi:hypothetical protein
VIGVVPVQVPLVPLSVWPSCAVPEMVGSDVLTGGVGATTAVCALVALELPAELVPVTRKRIVEPTSACPST